MPGRTSIWEDEQSDDDGRRPDVAERILALIHRRELGPGDLLPAEAELGRLLRASRPSIREALRGLAALDQVEVRHGQGTFVGRLGLGPVTGMLLTRARLRPSPGSLADLLAIAHALDGAVAELLVARPGDGRLVDLGADIQHRALAGQPVAPWCERFRSVLMEPAADTAAGELAQAVWYAAYRLSERSASPASSASSASSAGPGFLGLAPGAVGDSHLALAAAVRAGSVTDLRAALDGYYAPPG
ncbi:MAG TPA: GntR family transcriptional regulator [Dermatophilaceae bacterium]|nr:GntR family transcriptional regulator [Dermatophilaceae bacterium]